MHSKIQRFFSKLEKHSVKVYDFNEIKIEESLGEGGFGEVYKGYVCGEKRALKRLFFEMDELDGFLCDLLKEMVYSKDLVSKRLTRVYGISYDQENEEMYVIMELLNTGDLWSYIRRKQLTRLEKREIFDSLVLAVKDLHKLNYIHSDLKPENLCYYNDYERGEKYIKILDYNLMEKLPKNKEVMWGGHGTYGYSAPEQFKEIICKKSDVYAAAVIYLEMLCGENIWSNSSNNYAKCRQIVLSKLEQLKQDEDYELLKKYLRYGYSKREDF